MTKRKLVFGVGINDADYDVVKYQQKEGKWVQVWWCPYYWKWKHMLNRCYSKRYQEKQPTYKGCSVCDEWLLFSNFKSWMEQQEWEGRALDKDFLVGSNKVYSPSTCVFVPQEINNFLTIRSNDRGIYPIGVTLNYGSNKNPYKARCNKDNSRVSLGVFSTPEQAHQAWLVKKVEICSEYLVEFKNESLITLGLTRIKDVLEFHIENNLELTSF